MYCENATFTPATEKSIETVHDSEMIIKGYVKGNLLPSTVVTFLRRKKVETKNRVRNTSNVNRGIPGKEIIVIFWTRNILNIK